MDKPPYVPVKGTSACPQASSVDKPAPAQNIVQKNHTCTTKLPTNSAYQAYLYWLRCRWHYRLLSCRPSEVVFSPSSRRVSDDNECWRRTPTMPFYKSQSWETLAMPLRD